jgi:hypothetical protein
MIALTERYFALGEQALADSMRFSSICLDCATRLGTIQAEIAEALLMRGMRPSPPPNGRDAPAAPASEMAMDELLYRMGEANRVLVESQSQLRLMLEERFGDTMDSAPHRTRKRAAARAAFLVGHRPLKGTRAALRPRNVRLARMNS